MLTKEISEVEKGMERLEGIHKHWSDEFETFEDYTLSLDLLGMKLSTLKSAQAKFDKLKEDEIGFLNYLIEYPELCREKCKERKDELSSKEGINEN